MNFHRIFLLQDIPQESVIGVGNLIRPNGSAESEKADECTTMRKILKKGCI